MFAPILQLRTAQTIPPELLFLLLIVGIIIFLWDMFERRSSNIRKSGGLDEKSEVISIRGSSQLPAKEYTSFESGLTSMPDALSKEGGFIIPVSIKPMSKKVRDRHVVELLVHLKLIEEKEGKRPPYGILVLGPEGRSVKIKNSDDKQRWLESLLDEMRSIIDGVPAVPKPALYKCKSCDVRMHCNYSEYKET